MEGLIIVKKMDKKKAEEIAREQLKNVGLLEWANHYPAHLSGGQQQSCDRKSTCDGTGIVTSG